MYIKKITGYLCNDEFIERNLKGRLDTFTPQTIRSKNYKNWRAILDLRICTECRLRHGQIYKIDEDVNPAPPLHHNCRCDISVMESIIAGNATNEAKEGADYRLKHFSELPEYYITKNDLIALGWKEGKKPSKYAPGKMYSKGIYDNLDLHLPDAPGRIWYEADINYYEGRRNKHRVLWSNDGLIFVTYDHYETFYEII